jgi:hypothetical protein
VRGHLRTRGGLLRQSHERRNVLKLTLQIASICLVFLWPNLRTQAQTRTVDANEAGSEFSQAVNFPWSDIGARVGATYKMNSQAIKAAFSRFHAFAPSDQTRYSFPYSALRTYEKQQVAAGHAPIFITATYQGKKRPVLWSWALHLSGNRPTAPSNTWEYAVNVGDERFVNFWVTKFARPVVLDPIKYMGNVWVWLDACGFNYRNYGVIDDSGHFVAGVPWDSPFPRSDSQYIASVAAFFKTLTEIAPDIKVMPNVGGMLEPGLFPEAFAYVPGASTENIYGWHSNPSSYVLNNTYTQTFTFFSWLGAHNRATIIGANLPSTSSQALITAFATYELLKGVNSFFAPRYSDLTIVNPSAWMPACARLGKPLATFQSRLNNRFFSRAFAGGFVYLNWTGTTQTVTLPTGHKWIDPSGRSITRISVANMTGTYVRLSS